MQFCEEFSMMKTKIFASGAMAVLAMGLFGGVAAKPARDDGKAPVLKMEGAKIVPDQYIVVMKKGAQVSSEVTRRTRWASRRPACSAVSSMLV